MPTSAAAANDIFEDLTEKFYEIGGRVDNLIEPPPTVPSSPMRPTSSSVSGSILNTAMHKVSDTTTYKMVPAKVSGLLAIIKNQISKLKVHSQNK